MPRGSDHQPPEFPIMNVIGESREDNGMTFTATERREYREYADAAEFWGAEGDYTLATEALSDAIYAAGFDNSELRYKDLLDILTLCHGKLPTDPWFLTVLARNEGYGKTLRKRAG